MFESGHLMKAQGKAGCFDDAPEFVDEDNRRFRVWNPVSKEQMFSKHSVLLPPETLKGKTVLDLGCCMGATGHWCLSHGATHYTGVELQKEYVEAARRLHDRYHPGKTTIHQMAIEQWLAQPNLESFDIACILGVIYAFIDYFSILKMGAVLTRETFVIEGMYSSTLMNNSNFCGVEFVDGQQINLANERSSVIGRGSRVSPKGMEWLMEGWGFKSHEGIIRPPPISDVPDIYNRPVGAGMPVRYLMRFERVGTIEKSVSEHLQQGGGERKPWTV